VGIREKRQIHREKHSHHWQSRLLDWRIYLIFYLLLLCFTIYYTDSRGSWVSFVVMCCTLVACSLVVKSDFEKFYNNNKWFLLVGFITIIFVGLNVVSDNFSEMQSSSNGRFDIWLNSFNIFKDYWLTGIGNGSFQYVYPLYDSGHVEFRLEHAHNDYLELLIEQGVIGFSLVALIIFISVKNAVIFISQSKNYRQAAFAIASILGITGMLVHSLFDFNFQIPSNAIHFFVFLGLASLQGVKSVHKEKRDVNWDEELFKTKHFAK
jgi:O-antigen ligase